MQLVSKGRADVGIVSRSTFRYLLKQGEIEDEFYISSIPHDRFQRRILVPSQFEKLYQSLEQAMNKVSQDPIWLQQLADNE